MVEGEHGRDSRGELFTVVLVLPQGKRHWVFGTLRLVIVAGHRARRREQPRSPMIQGLLVDRPLDTDFLHDLKPARPCQDADDSVVTLVAGVLIHGLFHF